MCLEQDQQEHKSRFNDTNPEIKKKKRKKNSKSKPSQINDNTSKSSNINNIAPIRPQIINKPYRKPNHQPKIHKLHHQIIDP